MHARDPTIVAAVLLAVAGPLHAVPRPWPVTSRRETASVESCAEFLAAHPVECCGSYSPTCDDGGGYAALQCHGSTGYCWCVDMKNNRLGDQARPWEDSTLTEEGCGAVRLAHEEAEQQLQHADQDQEEAEGKPKDPSKRFRIESLIESGLFVFFFAIAAGCMWIQWTSGRGQSLAGKEYEMDATMLDPKERARAEAEGVPVAVIQDKAGQVAM